MTLMLAAFGLFAALRIAHGYATSVERASAVIAFAPSAWQRKPSGGTDRLIAAPIAPPVVARSEPAESEVNLEAASMRSEPPAGNAAPGGIAEGSEPSPARTDSAAGPAAQTVPADAPRAASGGPAPGTAVEGEPTGSIDRAAVAAPASEGAVASPQQAKRHPAVKRHVVRKRVRRVARRPASSGAATSWFQPMFSSP